MDSENKKYMNFASLGEQALSTTNKLSSSTVFDKTIVNSYFDSPQENSEELRKLSDWFYYNNGLYKNIITTNVNLPTLDYLILPDEDTVERNSEKAYHEYLSKVKDYYDAISLKQTTRRILKSVFKYGGYVGYLREKGRDKFLQTLPLDYCRIKSWLGNNEYIVEFNFKYFDKFWQEEDLKFAWEVYPPEFKRLYNKYKRGGIGSEWQMLTSKNVYCLPYDDDEPFFIPPYSGMFKALISDEEQKRITEVGHKLDIMKIIIQRIPKDAKGNVLMNKDDVVYFHKILKDVLPEGATAITTPMDDVTSVSLSNVSKEKQDILKNSERNVFLNAGFNNALFVDSDGTFGINANIEIITANVYAILEKIENMFNVKVNKYIAHSRNYTFNLTYFRTTNINKDKEFERNKSLLSLGGALEPLIALTGMDVNKYKTLLKIENETGVKDLLQVPLTMNTANAEAIEAQKGRKPKDDIDASDSTNKNKDSGTDDNKKILE